MHISDPAPRPSLFARLRSALGSLSGRGGAPRKRNLELERLAKAPGPVAYHHGNPIALLTSGALRR